MAMVLRIMVFASVAWLVFVIVLIGSRIRTGAIGKTPIAWPAFVLAKVSLTVSFILLVWAAATKTPALPAFTAALVMLLLIAGSVVITLGMYTLGANLRMGLPGNETALITSGVFRFTRNPIYFAGFLFLFASLIYAFSWINLIAVAVAMILHHRIILAEEKYLACRFAGFDEYRRRVRRYI
jgi:protein-S-isoprenylcysteine O-methyltransferase Ste14